jgi:hypothetical protein
MDAPRAPQGMCKHKLAVMLYKRASEVLTSSCGRPQLTAADTPCPEALFSACLKGTVQGIDTQLTARGMTLAEFQRNFDAVHALFDVPAARPASATPAQASAQASGETPTCQYHGAMRESTKVKGTFYCPSRMGDGTFCKEKFPKK